MHARSILFRKILESARTAPYPLIFAVPGSGQIARCAIEGGAHFMMVLNAGLYRTAGVSSLGSFLPYGNANDQAENLVRNQIVPRGKGFPIVAGILANDPTMSLKTRLKRYKHLGISGVVNWPAVGLLDGRFRESLSLEGFTVEAEIKMLQEAKEEEFVTFGFATNPEDAAGMAEAGMDAVVLNLGWTYETEDIYDKADRIQHAVVRVNEMMDAVKKTGEDPVCLFFGGSVTSPEDTAELYRRTEIRGFGGGSVFERIPVSKLVTNTVRQFCSVPLCRETPTLGEDKCEMVGASPVMQKLYKLIQRVAPYDVNVCLEGESGVGKELVANQLHRLSTRASMPFITLNCGAIPDTLLESEFFGHEKGAFTGAVSRRLGKFELADRGTLFLDEVSELSPKAQVSLLRVIQQKEISRVGGNALIPVDVRIISATHQNLKTLVDQGRFRADLYYRLNAITIRIAPLRDRKMDIPALVGKLLKDLSAQFNRPALGTTAGLMNRLMKHSWPGNVRELRHVICRALLLEEGPVLEGEDFEPQAEIPSSEPDFQTPSHSMPEPMRQWVQPLDDALRACGGNKSRAARLMGISRKTLYSRIKKLEV